LQFYIGGLEILEQSFKEGKEVSHGAIGIGRSIFQVEIAADTKVIAAE
jgi:hypothetical protein